MNFEAAPVTGITVTYRCRVCGTLTLDDYHCDQMADPVTPGVRRCLVCEENFVMSRDYCCASHYVRAKALYRHDPVRFAHFAGKRIKSAQRTEAHSRVPVPPLLKDADATTLASPDAWVRAILHACMTIDRKLTPTQLFDRIQASDTPLRRHFEDFADPITEFTRLVAKSPLVVMEWWIENEMPRGEKNFWAKAFLKWRAKHAPVP